MGRKGGDPEELWRVALVVTGLILAWFGAFELLAERWIPPGEPSALKALHLVRGVGSSLLALAVTLYLTRAGEMGLPERPESARAVERVERKVVWLIRLRWLAAVGVVAALAVSRSFGLLEAASQAPLWLGGALLFAFNGGLTLSRPSAVAALPLALHLAVDSLILAYLLHFSGGVENPFFLLYLFHGQVGAILLPGKEAGRLVAWSAALLLLLGLGEMTGALTHHPLLIGHLPGAPCPARSPGNVGPLLAAFLTVHVGTAFFTSLVMGRLRRDNHRILAAERLSALGRIVGFVAHEVNNPIGVISMRAQLALSRPQQFEDPARMRALVETIARQADRVAGIVRTLLAGTQPASMRLGELRLAEVLDEAAERLAPRFKACGVALERGGASRSVLRDVRFSEVSQVVCALLLNALEASGRGGAVRLESSDRDGGVELRVLDEGPGMAPEDLQRLFEPFFSTKPQRGAGLGLAMCRAIVRSLGGEIAAQSERGKGSEFVVRLPAAAPREPPPGTGGRS